MIPPVSLEAYEAVSESASDDDAEIVFNVFKPPPVSIVMGSFTCPPPGLAEHYDLAGEQAEPDFCEARCLENPECNFFWHGEQGGTEVCRLYSDCADLTAEVGISGELKGTMLMPVLHRHDGVSNRCTIRGSPHIGTLEPAGRRATTIRASGAAV